MLSELLTKLEDRFGYLRYRTNWHKQPFISRVMCWLGRHDYEFDGKVVNGGANLYCFYCDAKKRSFVSSSMLN